MNPRDDYEIIPLVNFGPIEFGVTRLQASMLFSARPYEFTRGLDKKPAHAYFDGELCMYFDSNDRVQFVEAFACLPFGVSLCGTHPLKERALKILKKLTSLLRERPIEVEPGSLYLFREHSIALWREDETERHFQSVGAGTLEYVLEYKQLS